MTQIDIEKLRGKLAAGMLAKRPLIHIGYPTAVFLLEQFPAILSELERKTKALEEIVSRCPANTAAVKIAAAALKGEHHE